MKIPKFSWIFLLYLLTPIFIITFINYRFSSRVSLMVLLGMVMVYLLTALLHHYHHQTFRLEIIIEYVLIAALALIIFAGLVG